MKIWYGIKFHIDNTEKVYVRSDANSIAKCLKENLHLQPKRAQLGRVLAEDLESALNATREEKWHNDGTGITLRAIIKLKE